MSYSDLISHDLYFIKLNLDHSRKSLYKTNIGRKVLLALGPALASDLWAIDESVHVSMTLIQYFDSFFLISLVLLINCFILCQRSLSELYFCQTSSVRSKLGVDFTFT